MKTNETIRADVFIIPNPVFVYEGSYSQKYGEQLDMIESISQLYTNYKYSLKEEERRALPRFKDEKFVQVWYTTSESENSNWVDRKIDGYDELEGWMPETSYLPASMFNGYKEGDSITIDLPVCKRDLKEHVVTRTTVKVTLTLAQLKYRYREHGTFEEVLSKLC